MKLPSWCLLALTSGLLHANLALGQAKLSLSVQVAPHYTAAKTRFISQIPTELTGSPGTTSVPVDVNLRQTGQGYSLALMARYGTENGFSFSSGVLVNRTSYQTPAITTKPDLSADPNGVQFEGIATTRRNYQVPLLINYQSSPKRLSPYFSAGGIVSFPYTTIFSDGSRGKFADQKVDVYPVLGVGATYQLSNHLSLLAQPSFTYILPRGKFIAYRNYKLDFQLQALYTF